MLNPIFAYSDGTGPMPGPDPCSFRDSVAASLCIGTLDVSAQTRGVDERRGVGTELWIESSALLEPVTSLDFRERREHGREAIITDARRHPRFRSTFHRLRLATASSPLTVVHVRSQGSGDSIFRVRSSYLFTRVDYDVLGTNGEHGGVFSNTANAASVIGVRVVELPMRAGWTARWMVTCGGGRDAGFRLASRAWKRATMRDLCGSPDRPTADHIPMNVALQQSPSTSNQGGLFVSVLVASFSVPLGKAEAQIG